MYKVQSPTAQTSMIALQVAPFNSELGLIMKELCSQTETLVVMFSQSILD